MAEIRAALRRDPGLALLLLALALAAALYAPTLAYGLTNYDDPWLVGGNPILRAPSWASVHAVWFELDVDHRFLLGAEYLPVRDMSVMLDAALWGDHYGGAHATNLACYLAAIAAWFAALARFGIDRKTAGLALLLWALHPAHAESVAWLAERKGVLGMLLSGVAVLGYARYRAGDSARWLVLAIAAAVAAVWSKAPAAFAVASLAALEVALPARRVSWRRSALGIAAIGAFAIAAFVPVIATASRMGVVGQAPPLVAGRAASVVGFHGFYVELAALAHANAPSYAIVHTGPDALDLAIGALALAACGAALWRGGGELRAAAALWLLGWLPVSHLVLPVQTVALADRYVLFATLGAALAVAAAIARVPRPVVRRALIAALCVAAGARTLDARTTWASSRALWERAVASDPSDPHAWSELAEVMANDGDADGALAIAMRGLTFAPGAALWSRIGVLELSRGDVEAGTAAVGVAAELGDATAMANFALLVPPADGLPWARRAVAATPLSAHAQRTLGKLALATGELDDATAAFSRAVALEPGYAGNHYNLALALIATGRTAEARDELAACAGDPRFADLAAAQLAQLGVGAP